MEEYKKMLMVLAILFKNNVPVEESKLIGTFIEKLIEEKQQEENKQKEFIEWLEANLEGFKLCDKNFFLTNYKKEIKSYEVILQKYKEIVGDKDE